MKALYTAASGMAAQQLRLDNIANNLANVNTTAYKKSRHSFQDLYYQEISRGGMPEGSQASSTPQIGGGVRVAAIQKDQTQGVLTNTGEPLNMALDGPGFFVLDTPNGEPLYTRDGSFAIDAEGFVQTPNGYRLAGGIQIPQEAESVQVTAEGEVQVKLQGDNEYFSVGQVEVNTFVNPAGLRSMGGNLYGLSPESGEPTVAEVGVDVKVLQGYVEGSNVDVAQELIDMIMAQRSFELTSKVVQAADETMQVASNLRR